MRNTGSHIVLRQLEGVTAELRQCSNGGTSLPPHFHEEYQVILSEHRIIRYRYRGAVQISPLGILFIVHPGEVHSAEVLANTELGRPLRAFLISPSVLASFTTDSRDIFTEQFYSSPIVTGNQLFLRMVSLHRLLLAGSAPLTEECVLLETLGKLLSCSTPPVKQRFLAAPNRLSRVRDYFVASFVHNFAN